MDIGIELRVCNNSTEDIPFGVERFSRSSLYLKGDVVGSLCIFAMD